MNYQVIQNLRRLSMMSVKVEIDSIIAEWTFHLSMILMD
jgi:hypothetical protein